MTVIEYVSLQGKLASNKPLILSNKIEQNAKTIHYSKEAFWNRRCWLGSTKLLCDLSPEHNPKGPEKSSSPHLFECPQ